MAKKLSARVAATTGQGISRLSYQQGRALAGGTPPIRMGRIDLPSSGRNYAKTAKLGDSPPIVADYGDTIEPGDLADISALGKTKVPKSWKQNLNPAKLKGPK